MTGNDIVDMAVAAAESNWRRKGFLEKTFSLQEQEYIKYSSAPDEMIWKLWTMKESAYKIYTRQYSGRFYAPQKFSCTLTSNTDGIVSFNNIVCKTKTIAAKNYIYSIARPAKDESTTFINSCFHLPQTQHTEEQQQFIYNKIIARYNSASGKAKKNMTVAKDKNGIPFLYCGNDLQIPVSITHHGHFAAFTIY